MYNQGFKLKLKMYINMEVKRGGFRRLQMELCRTKGEPLLLDSASVIEG